VVAASLPLLLPSLMAVAHGLRSAAPMPAEQLPSEGCLSYIDALQDHLAYSEPSSPFQSATPPCSARRKRWPGGGGPCGRSFSA
jgi:hypothetical protein